jgi:saccharopine dehydrogenase-like NADP-dependent oxidoreductase
MGYAKPYYISPAFAFTAYPNRDSTPFIEFYNIPEAETVIRGTLRYQGFPEFIKVLVQLGWLDTSEKVWLKEGLTWAQVMQNTLGTNNANERYDLFFFLLSLRPIILCRFFQYFGCPHQGDL